MTAAAMTAADVDELEQIINRGLRLLERLRATAPPARGAAALKRESAPAPPAATKQPRPKTVQCGNEFCDEVLLVGPRGRIPTVCRPCWRRRARERKLNPGAARRPAPAPVDPAAAAAEERRQQSKRRIETTLALASRPGAPLVKSQLLQRFDARRRPRG